MNRTRRIACVELHALPLQLLLVTHPEWKGLPVVVVDEDKPQGLILWANERARSQSILSGMRYSQALSLDGAVRAGTVSPHMIADWRKRILRKLRHYSPHIDAGEIGQGQAHERAPIDTGSFFLDASGLWRIYPSLDYWARAMHAELRGLGLYASIVVGFERFHTYAIARSSLHREPIVLASEAEEREAAERVRLDRMPIAPAARDMLAKLSVHTVGALLALPESGLRKHFGRELEHFVQSAKGTRAAPLPNTQEELPLVETIRLDEAEQDQERLLFLVKRALHPLLATLAERSQALCKLELHLQLEKRAHETTGQVLRDAVSPHEATLDQTLVLELVRLKLSALFTAPSPGGTPSAAAAVQSIALRAVAAPATKAQLQLFAETPRRDLKAAERAFARLRAEFGPNAVMMAVTKEGHLPEARFGWSPMERVSTPAPRAPVASASAKLRLIKTSPFPSVRRFFPQPVALPGGERHPTDGWLIAGVELGAVTKLTGPHILSGGWWKGDVHRDYYFAEVKRGDVLWVYFDHGSRSWHVAGVLS